MAFEVALTLLQLRLLQLCCGFYIHVVSFAVVLWLLLLCCGCCGCVVAYAVVYSVKALVLDVSATMVNTKPSYLPFDSHIRVKWLLHFSQKVHITHYRE